MNLLSYITSLFALIFNLNNDNNIINLSNYKYPKPNDPDFTYVPIICTTDIHGYAFDREISNKKNTFHYGGVSLLYSYIKAIRAEYGDKNVLWFDAGDKYQGAIESTDSNGQILNDFFNYAKVDLNVLGNHEYDNGVEFLKKITSDLNSETVTTNLLRKHDNSTDAFNGTKRFIYTKNITMHNKIKIGIIGFSPFFNYYREDIQNALFFRDLMDVVNNEGKSMKEDPSIHAVILFIHEGITCELDDLHLDIYNKSATIEGNNKCDNVSMLYQYLSNETNTFYFDAIIGGHVHAPGHRFFKGIPIVHSVDRGINFNILYLPFHKQNNSLSNDNIKIEGPIPVCDKVDKESLLCGHDQIDSEIVPFYFHKSRIRFDKQLERKVLSKYEQQFSKYREVLCENNINETLIRNWEEEVILGNIMVDFIRESSGTDVAILNDGALRAVWHKGKITLEDVWNMNPFKSDVMSLDFTGEELYRMIATLQTGEARYFHTSGIRQYFIKVKNETNEEEEEMKDGFNFNDKYYLSKLEFLNGTEINNETLYKVGMNDYLANGGTGMKEVFEWYLKKNELKYGDLVELFIEWLKNKEVLEKSDFWSDDISKRRRVFQE